MTWICDLDGVIWRGTRTIPGAPEAIARLRAAGHRVLFVTNNSSKRVAEVEAELAAHGVPAVGDVVTSAAAAATLLDAGARVLVAGGPGLAEAVLAVGAVVIPAADVDAGAAVDAVVVGYHDTYDYAAMRRAADAIRSGARFLASNDDATYPTAEGLLPGCGAIVAGIAVAAGREAELAGKPYPAMVSLLHARSDRVDVVVGDRPSTDGKLATALGARFGLVLTGVTTPGDLPVDPTPDAVAADLAELVELELGG